MLVSSRFGSIQNIEQLILLVELMVYGFTYSIVGANNTTNFIGYTNGTVYPIGGNNGTTTYPTGRANGKTYPIDGINGIQRVKKLGNKSDEK